VNDIYDYQYILFSKGDTRVQIIRMYIIWGFDQQWGIITLLIH